jgi:oxygen-independent coproporphyrinogen III oxidase
MLTIDKQTITSLDIAGPRYTSYPTAPNWTTDVTAETYIDKLKAFGQSSKTLSLYIHIPFCQTMCTFCACSVIIRKSDEKYGEEYLKYLFKEIDLVAKYIGTKKPVKQFHWGGGTPTFLSEQQIEQLFNKVKNTFDLDLNEEIAIEIDPRTVTESKIKLLRRLGFNRISMGVQDFDPDVQKDINRIQPFDSVQKLTKLCRDLKFKSVNFDLIYGLPNQTQQTFQDTIQKVIELKPDRIALYSFAYVPWLKKHQTKIDKNTLPTGDEKLDLFLNSREQFLKNGYQAIAMDHFALTNDEMAHAYNENRLYRNFMGYTVKPADEYIGLGLTSIGFLEHTFIQNKKVLADYYVDLDAGKLPVERGKVLSEDDRIRQWVIHSLMCHFHVDKAQFETSFGKNFDQYFHDEKDHLIKCEGQELIAQNEQYICVTELGKLFIRNICMGFDIYLRQQNIQKRFSQTV